MARDDHDRRLILVLIDIVRDLERVDRPALGGVAHAGEGAHIDVSGNGGMVGLEIGQELKDGVIVAVTGRHTPAGRGTDDLRLEPHRPELAQLRCRHDGVHRAARGVASRHVDAEALEGTDQRGAVRGGDLDTIVQVVLCERCRTRERENQKTEKHGDDDS